MECMFKYKLEVYTIKELGARDKQEDSIYPEHGHEKNSDRLFILCDGMGGHDAGEIASSTVCSSLSMSILSQFPDSESVFTDDDFIESLNLAFDSLDLKDNGAIKKMGTTLAFLKFHDKGATIAHIGDSRVYHIRPAKYADGTEIKFQTWDHSLVNDLIKINELTPEEAKNFKRKNVITRAMQPCMDYRPKADLYHTQDIHPGDYFMLCSDGMLEQIDDSDIRFIFSDKGGNIINKVDILKKITIDNLDNHSAIIIHILNANIKGSSNFADKSLKEIIYSIGRHILSCNSMWFICIILICVLLISCLYIVCNS